MNGWSAQDYGIAGAQSGVIANVPVSKEFPITAGGATQALVLKIVTASVTNVGTQTLKLQTAIGSDWVDSKTAVFTAAGASYIKLLAEASGDQTYLPLLNKGRVVLTQTNAGDVVTIVSCELLQEM